jgi:hypothetical protein
MFMPIAPISTAPRAVDESLSAFDRALRWGRIQALFARLTGHRSHLAPLAEAGRDLGVLLPQPERLEDIPLAAIIGSSGRSHDYTRSFLPRRGNDASRWASVYRQMVGDVGGLPPIVVRRLGDRYYVVDGHHRVSVSRWRGYRNIEAYVTELRPLHSPETSRSRQRHAGVTAPCLA